MKDRKPPPASEITIDRVGSEGDGIGRLPDGTPFYVPLALPGETVQARPIKPLGDGWLAFADSIDHPSEARVEPPCRHFGRCGGCALQHLDTAFVAGWKRERVVAALSRVGLAGVEVTPVISIPPRTRRRATFAAKRIGRRVVLGLTERASHKLVDLQECWVLRPELVALVAPLRERLVAILDNDETADISATLTDSGIDLLLIRQRALTLSDRESLAGLAQELDLARVAWKPKPMSDAEPVSARRTPAVRVGVRTVTIPSGGFLQPSDEGQAELTRLVMDALKDIKGPICDLFSGIGVLALPASQFGPVTAYDSDRAAIASLAAVRVVTASHRDLFREPLTTIELAPFHAMILDPPRAGAQAQARMLAASAVPLIAYVSCNPVSFARDAAILAEGGYALTRVTPVDQFLWSPHVELVALFSKSS